MNEAERISRLEAVLGGTGARVNDAWGVWAQHSQLADQHITQLADWADLQFLIAGSSLITDVSLPLIYRFTRLTDLSLGGNAITSEAIAACDLPNCLQVLDLSGIPSGLVRWSRCSSAIASMCST